MHNNKHLLTVVCAFITCSRSVAEKYAELNAQATGQLIHLLSCENKREPEYNTTILSLSRLHSLQIFWAGEDCVWKEICFFSFDTQDFLFCIILAGL